MEMIFTFTLTDLIKALSEQSKENGKRWISSTPAYQVIERLTGLRYDDLYRMAQMIDE